MKIRHIILALFLASAIGCKWSFEGHLQRSQESLQLGNAVLSMDLRSKLGQNFALALLGGFRGVVADFVWFKVSDSWEKNFWFKLHESVELAVTLQPRSIYFWDTGAWHMAYNASFSEGHNVKYPSEAYRIKAQWEWIEKGRSFLERGIAWNPDHYELYFQMGWLMQDQWKYNDPLRSIPFFEKASQFPDAPYYISRQIGIMYEKGKEPRKAYEYWKKLWLEHLKDPEAHPDQLWYKIEEWGRNQEKNLGIPMKERVFPLKPLSRNLKPSP